MLMVYCVVSANATFTNVSLLCIHLFSCKAASVFNILTGTYLLTTVNHVLVTCSLTYQAVQ